MSGVRVSGPARQTYDPRRGTVWVVDTSRGRNVPKAIAELVDGRTNRIKVHPEDTDRRVVDFLVTGSALSARIERKADQMQAIPVVLPEANEWLREQIRIGTVLGGDVYIRVYRASD